MSAFDCIIQLIGAFGGAVGFALLFNVQKEELFLAGVGGFLGWAVYLLCGAASDSDVVRFFVASVCFTLYTEPMSRIRKVPSTVFLVPAAIPMVPGASLFRSMRFAVDGRWEAFSHQILYTLLLAVAIAGGIVCGMALYHIAQKVKGGSLGRRCS